MIDEDHGLVEGVLAVGGVADGVGRVDLAGQSMPLPALAVTAAVVPLVKLLLGTSPAAGTWTATTRRPVRAPRPPVTCPAAA